MIRLRRLEGPPESPIPKDLPLNALQLADGGHAVLEEGVARTHLPFHDVHGDLAGFEYQIDWQPIEVTEA